MSSDLHSEVLLRSLSTDLSFKQRALRDKLQEAKNARIERLRAGIDGSVGRYMTAQVTEDGCRVAIARLKKEVGDIKRSRKYERESTHERIAHARGRLRNVVTSSHTHLSS